MLILFYIAGIFSGCVGQPVKYSSNKTNGQWSGSLKITDHNTGKSNSVDFEAIADRRWGERVDISALLGTLVGVVVVRPKSVRILVVDGKRYYKGPVSARSLRPLLGVNIDPRLLKSVLFDDFPSEKHWECQTDERGLPKKCINEKGSSKILWSDRDGEHKTVRIELGKFTLEFEVSEFQKEVELKSKQFRLTRPRGYKVYKIRPRSGD